jgi:hypothetical protein
MRKTNQRKNATSTINATTPSLCFQHAKTAFCLLITLKGGWGFNYSRHASGPSYEHLITWTAKGFVDIIPTHLQFVAVRIVWKSNPNKVQLNEHCGSSLKRVFVLLTRTTHFTYRRLVLRLNQLGITESPRNCKEINRKLRQNLLRARRKPVWRISQVDVCWRSNCKTQKLLRICRIN